MGLPLSEASVGHTLLGSVRASAALNCPRPKPIARSPVTDLESSSAAIRALLADVDHPDALTEAARLARALLSSAPGAAARDLKRFIELIEFAETPVDGETQQLIRAAWQTFEVAALSPSSDEPTPTVRDPDSVAIFADFLQEAHRRRRDPDERRARAGVPERRQRAL